MKYICFALSLLLLFFGFVDTGFALCVDGRHPSVAQEFEASKYVIIGMQFGEHVVTSSDDPEGVAATIYSVNPVERFKGNEAHKIEIWSENSSSRFVIEKGKKYLLFIRSDPDGFYVDNCGNSGPLESKNTAKTLMEVRSLTPSKN